VSESTLLIGSLSVVYGSAESTMMNTQIFYISVSM